MTSVAVPLFHSLVATAEYLLHCTTLLAQYTCWCVLHLAPAEEVGWTQVYILDGLDKEFDTMDIGPPELRPSDLVNHYSPISSMHPVDTSPTI